MSEEYPNTAARIQTRETRFEFWPGMVASLDLGAIRGTAVPVKGVMHHRPERFLEIYEHTSRASRMPPLRSARPGRGIPEKLHWRQVRKRYLPQIPGVNFRIGERVAQPPFAWREAEASFLAVSFTYNTNAFCRIFSILQNRGHISPRQFDALLDSACRLLAEIYCARHHFLIRHINNNLNMYLISKVIECLVGKACYNSELQELDGTRSSFAQALVLAREHAHAPVLEKMGLALGTGVSFMESKMIAGKLPAAAVDGIQGKSYQYFRKRLAIDHRSRLIEMIANAGQQRGTFLLAVILDDTTETVDDLLWLQDLAMEYPFLKVNLLVNTAQVSINFSLHLLPLIAQSGCFHHLARQWGGQFIVTPVYCPFITFQANYLPAKAKAVIHQADALFVKGANFFETCQFAEKHRFHAFVVYGPVSRYYTGLRDFDGVFAYLPAGTVGYQHPAGGLPLRTLSEAVARPEVFLPPHLPSFPTRSVA